MFSTSLRWIFIVCVLIDNMKFDEFKEKYIILQKKHSLPNFDEMNSAFDIGKLKRDSGNLIRDIRRTMVEKIVYYLKLSELILNPSQASSIFMVLLKEVTTEDKKIVDSIISSFVDLELKAHKLDISSTEKDESDLIIKLFNSWNEKKQDLVSIIEILERNWKQAKNPLKKNKDYFN